MAGDKKYVVLEKEIGETPLHVVNAWKAAHPEYAPLPATYAGRLDPMASGKLLVLLGEECKRKKEYTDLDKEYEIEILLGIGSDTGDVLGLVESAPVPELSEEGTMSSFSQVCGTHTVPYPIFSSKTVQGKPLFLYALQNALDTISIPTHAETIYTIQLISKVDTSLDALRIRVTDLLKKVPHSEEASKKLGADFRIHAVRNSWQGVFFEEERPLTMLRLRVTCASGTYMRTLANRLGEVLETRALCLSITRTKIGSYTHMGPVGFWTKQF